jgi:hypothetical protein
MDVSSNSRYYDNMTTIAELQAEIEDCDWVIEELGAL